MPNRIDLVVEIPPLPEGWSGTPDEFFEFFKANAIFSFDGSFPSGQVGGSKPTEDVGIWYNSTSIESFRNGKYQPISDVPVGAILMWPSAIATPPDNFLFCEASSLVRADYPELFAQVGTTYGSESVTTFNLPDFRGRFPSGSGSGDYLKPQGITGKIISRSIGEYYGYGWPTNQITAAYPNAPTKSMTYATFAPLVASGKTNSKYASALPPSLAMRFIIRTR